MTKRILFITATRIGDAVLSTGLLDWLTRTCPDARFTIACGSLAASLFERHPRLDRVIVLRKRPYAGHWRALWHAVRGEKWDLVVDLRRSIMPWLLRARRRASVPKPGPVPEHRVELVARTLRLPEAPAPRLWLTDADRARAVETLRGTSEVLAVAPTANWAAKTWPAERFAELASRLTGDDGAMRGATVFITGGPGEEPLVTPILRALPAERVVVRMGLDLPTTAAVFERARLFVGNDSGLMHIAAAVGTSTVGLFGPTRDAHYAPWGAHCRTVRTLESVDELVGAPDFDHLTTGSLMESLTVDAVERAAIDLLESSPSAGSTWPATR